MRNRFRKWRNTSKVTQPNKYLNQVCLTPAPYVYSLSPPPTCLSIYLNITMRYTPQNWNLRSLKFHNLIINTNKGEKVGLSLFKAHLNNYFLFPSIWPIPGLFNSCTLKKWYAPPFPGSWSGGMRGRGMRVGVSTMLPLGTVYGSLKKAIK